MKINDKIVMDKKIINIEINKKYKIYQMIKGIKNINLIKLIK